LSAGTSWRSHSSRRSGGGGLVGFVAIALLFLLVAWPYLLATYIAVKLGAPNPSTARSVVGWGFEFLVVAGLIVGITVWATKTVARTREEERLSRARVAAQEREEARRHAELVASGVVYQTRHGNSIVYRHGACTINHRTAQVAERCRSKG
jgi:hypothetical protein